MKRKNLDAKEFRRLRIERKQQDKTMFIAEHKQTHRKIAGTFDELCDLDKRIWDLKKFVNPLTVVKREPLCKINVYARPRHAPHLVQRSFFDHEQFKNIFLGG